MIPWLLDLTDTDSALRVLRYVTVRAAVGLALAFIVSLVIGGPLIAALRRFKMGQPILTITHRRDAIDLSEMHGKKAGTPTMGGLMILFAVLVPALLLCDLTAPIVWLLLALSIGLASVGGWDDYLKISRRNARGLLPRYKMLGQVVLGLLFGLALVLLPDAFQPAYHRTVPVERARAWAEAWGRDVTLLVPEGETLPIDAAEVERWQEHWGVSVQPTSRSVVAPGGEPRLSLLVRGYEHIMVPFAKDLYPDFGWLYILWVAFVIVAMSNAVNLTDGLDGLAIGVTTMAAICFAVIAYIVARPMLARYLLIPAVPDASEVGVLLGCLIGAAFGFLWFNAHPAEVFMGDVGSLMLGGILGGAAILLKAELLLVIVGGIFVIEAASALIQIGGYKLWGRRIFLMAPIHHHFEKRGLHESKIIARFWIIAALLALFGLATLKLR